MAKTPPKKLFAMWMEEGTRNECLSAELDIDLMKEDGAAIGVYELKEVRKFKLVEEK